MIGRVGIFSYRLVKPTYTNMGTSIQYTIDKTAQLCFAIKNHHLPNDAGIGHTTSLGNIDCQNLKKYPEIKSFLEQ